MSKVLIIDDDTAVNDLLANVVTIMGNSAQSAENAEQGLTKANNEQFDLVLLDVGLPDENGLNLLPRLKEINSAPEVVVITGDGDPDAAEMAIKNGAWDYLVKPSSVENIRLTIQRALAFRQAKSPAPRFTILKRDEIIGNSARMEAALERIAQAAALDANVLVYGETGTGKELFARAIHENSSRCRQPFVVVDCAALPETLVESVLFGHAKGAFTGADKERLGLIRQAHGGTLFLDEVGELPLNLQKVFLRVIQERRFRPLSGRREVEVDFRLIAATNRDLDAMVGEGAFRNDLLYRLRSLSIDAPPLRQRKGDIRRLAVHWIDRLCGICRCGIKGVSNEFIQALEQYDWPGNVRELFNALEEALALAGNEPALQLHHLPIRIRALMTRNTVIKHTSRNSATASRDRGFLDGNDIPVFSAYRDLMECHYLEKLNRLTRGNRKQACNLSGLSRTRLFVLLKKHNLSKSCHPPQDPHTAGHGQTLKLSG